MTKQTQTAAEVLSSALNAGSQSTQDLEADGTDLQGLIDGIKDDANTQYNGQYVFSGTQTATQPYSTADNSFHGGTDSVSRTVSQGASVAVSTRIPSREKIFSIDSTFERSSSTTKSVIASGSRAGIAGSA